MSKLVKKKGADGYIVVDSLIYRNLWRSSEEYAIRLNEIGHKIITGEQVTGKDEALAKTYFNFADFLSKLCGGLIYAADLSEGEQEEFVNAFLQNQEFKYDIPSDLRKEDLH